MLDFGSVEVNTLEVRHETSVVTGARLRWPQRDRRPTAAELVASTTVLRQVRLDEYDDPIEAGPEPRVAVGRVA